MVKLSDLKDAQFDELKAGSSGTRLYENPFHDRGATGNSGYDDWFLTIPDFASATNFVEMQITITSDNAPSVSPPVRLLVFGQMSTANGWNKFGSKIISNGGPHHLIQQIRAYKNASNDAVVYMRVDSYLATSTYNVGFTVDYIRVWGNVGAQNDWTSGWSLTKQSGTSGFSAASTTNPQYMDVIEPPLGYNQYYDRHRSNLVFKNEGVNDIPSFSPDRWRGNVLKSNTSFNDRTWTALGNTGTGEGLIVRMEANVKYYWELLLMVYFRPSSAQASAQFRVQINHPSVSGAPASSHYGICGGADTPTNIPMASMMDGGYSNIFANVNTSYGTFDYENATQSEIVYFNYSQTISTSHYFVVPLKMSGYFYNYNTEGWFYPQAYSNYWFNNSYNRGVAQGSYLRISAAGSENLSNIEK